MNEIESTTRRCCVFDQIMIQFQEYQAVVAASDSDDDWICFADLYCCFGLCIVPVDDGCDE